MKVRHTRHNTLPDEFTTVCIKDLTVPIHSLGRPFTNIAVKYIVYHFKTIHTDTDCIMYRFESYNRDVRQIDLETLKQHFKVIEKPQQ